MLRLTYRLREALSTEETRWQQVEEEPDDELYPTAQGRYDDAEAVVDHLIGELSVYALDLRSRVARNGVEVCVEAVRVRTELGPRPARPARRAAWLIDQMIKVSVGGRPWWRTSGLTKDERSTLKGLEDQVALVHEIHEENARAYEEWERDQRQRRQSEGQGLDDSA